MPARRRLRLLACLAAVVLLVGAACSDDDSSSDDPTVQDGGATDGNAADDGATDDGQATDGGEQTSDDPCSLLTPADLEEALTSPWDDGEATDQAQTGGSQCTWTNSDAPPVKTFSVVVYTTDSLQGTPIAQAAPDAAAYYQLNKDAIPVDEDLDIGDEAFRSGTTVWVLDGDTLYSFSTFLGDSGEATAGLVALAEKAVDG